MRIELTYIWPHRQRAEEKNNQWQKRAKKTKTLKDVCSSRSEQIFESQGRVSIDRSKVAALLSTTPRLQPRSSTNDLAPPRRMGLIVPVTSQYDTIVDTAREVRESVAVPPRLKVWCIVASRHGGTQRYRYVSGRDSDLEAFSRKPSDGSFAPSAYQPST